MSDSAPKSKLAYNIRLTVLFAVMAGIGGYYAFDNGYLDFYLPADWKKKQEKKVAGVPERFKNRKENKETEAPKESESTESKDKETDSAQAKNENTKQEPSTEPETAESQDQPASDKTPEIVKPSLAELESPNQVEPPVVTPPEETAKTQGESPALETEPSEKPENEVAVIPDQTTEDKQTSTDEKPVTDVTAEETASNSIPTPAEQREESPESTPQIAEEKEKVAQESPDTGTVVDPSKPSALQQLTNATSPHVETTEKPVIRNAPVPQKVQRYAALLMKRYDLDRSMRVEPAENKQFSGIPRQADLNGDGNITQNELAQYLANYGQGRKIRLITPYAPGETEEAAPTPESGGTVLEVELTEEEQKTAMELELERRRSLKFAVNTKRLPGGLPPWFLSRDNNGDGQLTLGEFAPNANKAAIEEFRKIDRNQDGLITPKEYVRGDKSDKKESASSGS